MAARSVIEGTGASTGVSTIVGRHLMMAVGRDHGAEGSASATLSINSAMRYRDLQTTGDVYPMKLHALHSMRRSALALSLLGLSSAWTDIPAGLTE